MRPAWSLVQHPGMKFPRALFLVVVGVVIALVAGGCSTTYQRAGVAISVVAVTVDSDNSAVLTLAMENENITPIAVSKTVHKVTLGGAGYGEARGEKPVALAERGKVRHEAVLKLDAAAANRLRAALAAGPLSYHLDSRLICEVGDEQLILTAVADGQVTAR